MAPAKGSLRARLVTLAPSLAVIARIGSSMESAGAAEPQPLRC